MPVQKKKPSLACDSSMSSSSIYRFLAKGFLMDKMSGQESYGRKELSFRVTAPREVEKRMEKSCDT